jgi:hypothetical protein
LFSLRYYTPACDLSHTKHPRGRVGEDRRLPHTRAFDGDVSSDYGCSGRFARRLFHTKHFTGTGERWIKNPAGGPRRRRGRARAVRTLRRSDRSSR